MTHFRIEVKTLSKAAGQSSSAAHLYDVRANRRDKSDLVMVGSVNMPTWSEGNPAKFWEACDKHERANACLARRIIPSFPLALPQDKYETVITEWLQINCPGMPASWAIHYNLNAEHRNPHPHLLISERVLDGIEREPGQFFKRYNAVYPAEGGCKKADIGSRRLEWLKEARKSWADILNQHLPADAQVDHRSLEDQGIFDRQPQPKLGAKVLAVELKGKRTRLVSSIVEDASHHAQIRCLTFIDQQTGREVTFKSAVVRDDRINIVGKPTRAKCLDIVKAAQAKGWASVEVTGTDEFQQMMKAELRKAGIKIKGERHEQNSQHHRNEDGRGSQPDRTASRESGSGRTPPSGGRYGEDRRLGGGSAGRDGKAGADHRDPAATPEASAQTNLRATDISVAGRGRTADVSDFRNDIHSLAESADGMPTDKKSGGDAMQKDLTSIMVQKQLKSLAGVDLFEVGIRDSKTGKMQNFEMARGDVLASILRLKRENTKGCDIYIRPLPKSNHPFLLLDDVGAGTINKMKSDGLEPVLQVETSQMNFQVLLRVPERLARDDRKAVERILQDRYGADPGSADGGHYFRLAGFTNRKPTRMLDNGKQPFVKVFESKPDAVIGDVWQSIKRESEQRQADELLVLAKPLPLPAAAKPLLGGVMRDTQVWQIGREQFQRAQEKWGSGLDLSRTDYFVSRNLLQMGATEDQVRRALPDISPDIQTRKVGHVEDYIKRTVLNAYCSLPSLAERDRDAAAAAIESQARHDQAERERLTHAIVEQDREKASRKSTSTSQHWRMK